jgi:hypothetical protein
MAKKKCDCIFCNFKCPECGATEIEITYSPVFTCTNDRNNEITLERGIDNIELSCQECNADLEYNEYNLSRSKLHAIAYTLNKNLEIPNSIDFVYDEEHGKIKSTECYSQSVEVPIKKKGG